MNSNLQTIEPERLPAAITPSGPAATRGPSGIHGDRSLMRIQKLDELDLLALTIEALTK